MYFPSKVFNRKQKRGQIVSSCTYSMWTGYSLKNYLHSSIQAFTKTTGSQLDFLDKVPLNIGQSIPPKTFLRTVLYCFLFSPPPFFLWKCPSSVFPPPPSLFQRTAQTIHIMWYRCLSAAPFSTEREKVAVCSASFFSPPPPGKYPPPPLEKAAVVTKWEEIIQSVGMGGGETGASGGNYCIWEGRGGG